MTDYIPLTPPIFQTSLAFPLNPDDTNATIASDILLTSGEPLSGLVCISIDIGQPNPEYCIGTLLDDVITFTVRNCDPLDPTTSLGTFDSQHGAGAVVKITDFATIQIMRNLLNGTKSLQNKLSYLTSLSFVNPTDIVDKEYVDNLITMGALLANQTTTGIVRTATDPTIDLGACDISIASPAVITLADHGLLAGDVVQFTTTGSLPTGIDPSTPYFVISDGLTSSEFEISATLEGTPINTSGSQSGTQELFRMTPYVVLNNDPRIPTIGEGEALAGTSGTPSSTNRYETENDTSNGATQTSTTISFTAATKTIADSGDGFVTSGFRAGDSIIVSGSASNDGTYTIVSVSAGEIVVVETLIDEIAGATDTISTATENKLIRLSSSGQFPFNIPIQGYYQIQNFIYGESIAIGAPVYLNSSDGKVYNASSASANETFYGYIGIALQTGTLGYLGFVATVDGAQVTGLSLPAATQTISQTADAVQSDTTGGQSTVKIYTGNVGAYCLWKSGNTVGNISQISPIIGKTSGGGGALTLTVYPVTMTATGFTVGSSLGSATVATPTAGANNFVFGTPIVILPNTFYCYQLTGATGDSSNYWTQSISTTGTVLPFASLVSSTFDFDQPPAVTTYYTSQINWIAGDNVFLSDTPGAINVSTPGTLKLPIATIISSSSLLMERFTGNKYIGSQTITCKSGEGGIFAIPKNCTRIVLHMVNSGHSNANVLDVKIGDNNTPNTITNYDGTNSITYEFLGTFGSFGNVGSGVTSGIVYFYK